MSQCSNFNEYRAADKEAIYQAQAQAQVNVYFSLNAIHAYFVWFCISSFYFCLEQSEIHFDDCVFEIMLSLACHFVQNELHAKHSVVDSQSRSQSLTLSFVCT